MRRSIETSTSPSPGIWTIEGWIVQIPSPRGKKAVQMPNQLVLKYLSSKTNFVFNQTFFTIFTERYVVITLSNCFWRPFWKSYSLTKAKSYLVNPSNLAKNRKSSREYCARTRDKSGSNSPPFQGNVQIPPFPGTMHSQMPGVCPRGGCCSFELIGGLSPWTWHFSVVTRLFMWATHFIGDSVCKLCLFPVSVFWYFHAPTLILQNFTFQHEYCGNHHWPY